MPFPDQPRVGGILVELFDGPRLDVRKCLRRGSGIARLHVLHLDQRGVGDVRPCLETRREGEIVEASARLTLVRDEVRPPRRHEKRHDGRLHNLLALHGIADGEVLLHDLQEDVDERFPIPVVRKVDKSVVDVSASGGASAEPKRQLSYQVSAALYALSASKLRAHVLSIEHPLSQSVGKPIRVIPREGVAAQRGIRVEAILNACGILGDGREVKLEDEILAALLT